MADVHPVLGLFLSIVNGVQEVSAEARRDQAWGKLKKQLNSVNS